MNGINSVYVPFWKRVTSIDMTTGYIYYSNFYYPSLGCAGTTYVNSLVIYSVIRNHFNNNHYTGDRLATPATYQAYSISDSYDACRNYNSGDDRCAPCNVNNVVPAVQVASPPFTLPIALPLTIE